MNMPWITAALLAVAGTPVLANETPEVHSFEPANFVTGKRSLEKLIKFPDIDFDTEVHVACSGHATAKGRLKNGRCSSMGDPELKFTMAVSRRFNAMRLIPARVDGKAEEVDFQFTVIFLKQGKAETITLYPHNMKNVDRLGLDYIGAQRYSEHPWPNRCGWRGFDDLIVEVAIVDATGSAKEFNVLSANFDLPASCQEGFASFLRRGSWIPAFHDDQFVESVWTNPRVLNSVPYKRQQ
jgi:hypothetical protein